MHYAAFVIGLFLTCSGIYSSVADIEFEVPEHYVDPGNMFTFDHQEKVNRKTDDLEIEVPEKQNAKKEKVATADETKPISASSETKHNQQQAEPVIKKPLIHPNSEIHEDWVDPSDMMNFDPKDKPSKSVKDESTQVEDHNSDTCQFPFLHRFVGVIYRNLEYVGSPPNVKDFEMNVHLDNRNWLVLQDFADNCKGSASEVTKVLEEMISDVHVHEKVDYTDRFRRKFEDLLNISFEDAFKILVCLILFVCMLSLEIFSSVSWSRQLKRVIVLGAIVSIAMTYLHELKLAEAANRSNLSKEIPPECVAGMQDLSIIGCFKSIFTDMFSVSKDPCTKYHESHLIDPKLTVTPTKVIAVTVTRFIVEPMEHVGTAFSKAFNNIFTEIPVTLWIPAFIFVIVVIIGFLLIVSVFFGYTFSFNLPFWTGLQMGPQNTQIDKIMEDNRLALKQQSETIQQLKEDLKKQKALPAPQTDVKTTAPRAILPLHDVHPAPTPYPPTHGHVSPPYPEFNNPLEGMRCYVDAHSRFYQPPPFEERATLRRRNTTPASYSQQMSSQGQGDGEYIFVSTQSTANRDDRRHAPLPRSNTIGFERIVDESNAEYHTTHLKIPVHPEGENSEQTSSTSTEPKHLGTQGVNENQQQSESTSRNIAGSGSVQELSVKEGQRSTELVLGSYHSEVESLPTIADETAAAGETWESVSFDFLKREDNENISPADLRMRFEQEAAEGISTVSDQ